MGSGRFDTASYAVRSASMVGMRTEDIYRSRSMVAALDPKGVVVRESRDSADNPASTPLIVGVDVTGSMHIIADVIARAGLGTLFTGILERRPITDPHVMFMAIGDANYDRYPLQVSQFEADNRIVEQLTQICLEKGGGGNAYESYDLPWYFAGLHTVHDSFERRGKRGYLFTVGDEEAPPGLTREQIARFIGGSPEADVSAAESLALAQRTYDVYHVVIQEGNHARRFLPQVMGSWTALLGQRVIPLADHTKLAETIVSAIEVAEGADARVATGRWAGVAAELVYDAVRNVPRGPGTAAA